MVTSNKFHFDTVFQVDKNGRNVEFDEPKPQFTDEDLAAARGEGQRQGFEAGVQQARGEIEAATAAALEQIAAQMVQINNTYHGELLSIEGSAAELAYCVGSKLAPALLARQPLEEVSALVADCLTAMPTEPRIVVRIADPMLEPLQAKIEELVSSTGFGGQIALLVEPGLSGSDCRVEWADGGAERDLGVLQSRVEDAVARYCAALERERQEFAASQANANASEEVVENHQAAEPDVSSLEAAALDTAEEEEDLLSDPLPVLNHIPDFGANDGAEPASMPSANEEFAPTGDT
jgi:flagellar assembly protein FliH